MTEHELKILHHGLGISKSSMSWARLPRLPLTQVPVQGTGHVGPTLCLPWGTQPVLI